jgi:hypothetical protein
LKVTKEKKLSSETELPSKLQELKDIWTRCSTSRKKNEPYKYVAAVYEMYRDLRSKRIASKTAIRIGKLEGLTSRTDRHPIRCIVDATCTADEKSKSRIARAIRFAHRQKWGDNILDKLKETGGIAGCAEGFARKNKKKRYETRL